MPGTSQFPEEIDAFPAIGPNTLEDDPAARHDVVHENVHAAIVAVQERIGVEGTDDEDSIEWRLEDALSRLGDAEAAVQSLVDNRFPVVVVVPGTSYELTVADIGKWLRFTAATEVTVTLGAGSWPANAAIELQAAGEGQVVVAIDAANLELAASLSPRSSEQFAVFGLKRSAAGKWAMFGMLEPT
jgi:hypothetical protein